MVLASFRGSVAPSRPPDSATRVARSTVSTSPPSVISSSAASSGLPTRRFASRALHASAAPPTGTPRCRQSRRPNASWTDVSGPGSRISITASPPVPRPLHPNRRQRFARSGPCRPARGSAGGSRRGSNSVKWSAADDPPATRQLGGIDAAQRTCDRHRAGRRSRPWRVEARDPQLIRQVAEVREARREAIEQHAQLRGHVSLDDIRLR